MLNNYFPLQRLSNNKNQENAIRAIVFSLPQSPSIANEEYIFALPLEAVNKIIICPPLTSRITKGIGTIELDSQMLTIVDLSYKFNLECLPEFYRFLILFKLDNGESCGIPVSQSPLTLDIPFDTVRTIPQSFRQANDLDFATHMAIVPNLEPDKIEGAIRTAEAVISTQTATFSASVSHQKIYLIGMAQILANRT
jgi:chemotaxis signal transduction protein